ncbi:hypothetical protein FRX31_025492 [Thalictrum thalictroides]|uniref:Uncharacterized protein n=1 Tax=Thalictrum thalictroides TaxID=46969 RepID=A0A7J6VKR2_THATH|nr:hypothetical protein FRX31_025492 [Thalictrum thalictroides]
MVNYEIDFGNISAATIVRSKWLHLKIAEDDGLASRSDPCYPLRLENVVLSTNLQEMASNVYCMWNM